MSRTRRNIEYSKFFTRPKTQNYRKRLHATKQEIKEELGPNYLKGNGKDYKLIPQSWDDKLVSACEETLTYSYYIERIFELRLKEIYGYFPTYLNIHFNKYKNRIEIGSYKYPYRRANPEVIYLPFSFVHKKYKFPVIILAHEWET
jgi:hypothetical protein